MGTTAVGRDRVLAVVVNWNGGREIGPCLDSIRSQTYPGVEVVVVDNGSTDGSLETIKGAYEELMVIENTTNLGYCKALNQGIDARESDFVLCLNSDVKLNPDYIEKAVGTLDRFPECGMLSGKILRFDGKTLDSTGQFVGRDRRPRERGYGDPDVGQYGKREFVFSVCGAVAFYRRKMLDQLALDGQYFDVSFFAFNEDLDIGWRGQLLGWKCVYEPRAVAHHARGGTAGAPGRYFPGLRGRQLLRRPTGIKYHIIKNRYLTVLKNDSLEGLLADIAFILAHDVAMWSLIGLTSPALLFRLPRMTRDILRALPKRAAVQSSRVVEHGTLRGGIV